MPDLVRVRSALLSVSDKAGVVDFARGLAEMGVRLISTGGTAKALAEAGLKVTPIEEVTGFPEMMDGRVKTLHPKVHGGLLGLRDAHGEVMRKHGIDAIDLVCINLYPFEATIAKPGVSQHDAIENIDIGGPSMIRSASKNFEWVAAVTSAGQYAGVLAAMRASGGSTPLSLRAALARDAFATTAAYDTAIAAYMGRAVAPVATLAGGASGPAGASAGGASVPPDADLPERLTISLKRTGVLSYGENPHQRAGVYQDVGGASSAGGAASVLRATKHHGKDLSYNNLNDAAAALGLAMTLGGLDGGSRAGAAVVKHTNPCGAAWGGSTLDAMVGAMVGDPLAAYGGILAVSREVDEASAAWLTERDVFLEVILAPSFEPRALERLSARWKNVRLLAVGAGVGGGAEGGAGGPELQIRVLPGGALVQTIDALSDAGAWTHSAGPAPSRQTLATASALEPIARALSSNAIAIGGMDPARSGVVRLFGAGAGQMDRVAACRLAVEKAGALARGAIAFSDAFFPFADGPGILMDAGVATIVHPGGSKRDGETFALCNERGVTCLTTGVRHFRH